MEDNTVADKEKIQKNISDNHAATQSSRYKYKGLTDQRSKLSSKNFNKLMQQRGLKKEDIKMLQESSTKGKSLSVRHAKAGEKVVITHGTQSASGVFVSEKSLGSTPQKRIDRGSLPVSNSAKYETKAQLDRDQNVIYGEIAPQRKFQKMDAKALPRNGGGEQVITDGGYRTGAVRNVDPKYPVPVKTDYAKKAQQFRTECSKSNTSGTSKSKSVSSTKKAGNNTQSHTTQAKGRRK